MRFLFIIYMLCFISCNQSKQTQAPGDADTSAIATEEPTVAQQKTKSDPILNVRQKVEHINTITLEKKHFEFVCDEKMMVDYFYHEDEIVKIAIDFGVVGDTYAKEDYYYDHGKLIFVYEFVEGGPACEGCIETNEYRMYVQNNKTIQFLKNQDQHPCRVCTFNKQSKQYKLLQASTVQSIKTILCPQ